ncbi:MAG: hypothetical protein RLZZ314_911, partial [Bacteroidota bacterium]
PHEAGGDDGECDGELYVRGLWNGQTRVPDHERGLRSLEGVHDVDGLRPDGLASRTPLIARRGF